MTGDGLAARLLDRLRITDGDGFSLAAHDTSRKSGLSKAEGKALLKAAKRRLEAVQERLAAQAEWSLLIVLQAMDAAGKDGTIRHVMSGVNPQGVNVVSFKQPGPEALAHDFLWRVHAAVPMRGHIGIFNRSHYEELLVCRVHPELLDAQHLPHAVRGDGFWSRRMRDIVGFETYLANQGIVVLKFFLHVSADEQRRRLLARLDDETKNWKFSSSDVRERARWDDYQDAYEKAIAGTASEAAPWFVVPADHKWYARLVVIEAIVAALEALDPRPPPPSADLDAGRAALGPE